MAKEIRYATDEEVDKANKKVMEVHKELLQRLEDDPVYDYVRVYFNSREDASCAWSVDSGPGTTEHKTRRIIIDYGVCTCQTEVDLSADNVNRPCAWLRIPAARLRILDNFIEVY